MNNQNLLSYNTIYSDIQKFKGLGVDREYRAFDEPANLYFKIIFYFNNPQSTGEFTSNLLGINPDTKNSSEEKQFGDDLYNDTINQTNWTQDHMGSPAGCSVNTAYNYLIINNELERAEYLSQFIMLLSEISSNSPWYFQELEGIDAAMEKKFLKEPKIEDEKRSINIKCLPDAYDLRISTMLDLYKAACFSYSKKKEIVPANLRKFDMGIYIFSMPTRSLTSIYNIYTKISEGSGDIKGVINNEDLNSSNYFTSCKYLEFHNCEFDIASFKNAYTGFKISEPTHLEHNITINYDDCYESRYNEFMMKTIGDFVLYDIFDNYDDIEKMVSDQRLDKPDSTNQRINKIIDSSYKYKKHYYQYSPNATGYDVGDNVNGLPAAPGNKRNSFWVKAWALAKGAALARLNTLANSFLLGNAHFFSISNIALSANLLAGGIKNGFTLSNTANAIGTLGRVAKNAFDTGSNIIQGRSTLNTIIRGKKNMGNINKDDILRKL